MKSVLLCLTIFFTFTSLAQEVCDNAIDDDGDGLIDLNDEDCDCVNLIDSSLIPNPSFEEMVCCPVGYGSLNCAEAWVQASGGTSDYFNTCGFFEDLGFDIFSPDLPLPGDGDGCGGFISQQFVGLEYNEYIGTCLLEPMVAGEPYTFSLYIARGSGNPVLPLSVFGTPDCTDLPWVGSFCPEGTGGWELLVETVITLPTISEWQEVIFTIVPPYDVNAIAIGGPCIPLEVPDGMGEYNYYFLDELALIEPDFFLSLDPEGGWCSGDLVLTATPDTPGGTYQWYKDGIALIGETAPTLEPIPYGDGEFKVVYTVDGFCISKSYTSPTEVEADFSISDEICFPGTTYLTNLTEDETDGFKWLFGDGEESEEESPAHIYALSGTYDISLIATVSDSTCNDTLTLPYVIMPRPTADFDFSGIGMFEWAGHDVGCVNNPINFEDLSTVDDPSTIVSWSWDFGDGTTSAEENPVHVYEDYGIYTVTLTVETEFGCMDEVVYEDLYIVTLGPDFTVEDECVFEEITFVNTSDALFPATLESFEWFFGDGGTTDTEDAIYTYTESGTYEVELIAVSESGCTDTMVKTVEVYPLPEPHFEFIVDGVSSEAGGTGGCYTSPVQFNDLSTVADPAAIVDWLWNFGDGETSTEENPIHLYESEGTYTVTLSVTSNFGCQNEISIEVLMTNGIAFLSPDTTICQNGTATVWAASSDGSFHTYDWSIPGSDDGATQIIEGLTEDYWVYVSSTNEAGCVSPVDSILITVLDPITLDISPFDTVCIGESSNVTVTPVGGNGDYTFEWTANGAVLPDNTPTITTSPVLITEYCVTVSDGCETTPVVICTEIYVPEMAVFTSDTTQGCEPTEITFTDLTGPVTALNESTWHIDGTTLFGNPVSYVFEEAGEYTVSLDVLSPEGCVTNNTVANYIIIHPLPEPELYATPNPTTYFNTEVDVVNINPDINSSFEWYLPGGSPEWAVSDSMVEVVYPELVTGNYSVSLIETTQYGCVDSTSITIVINNDQIIYAPNVFTPDGDGFNETWGIYIEGIDIYDFHLTMFNRWGEVIWESYNPAAQWDGSYGGEIVQDGVYVWVITAKDRENDKAYEYRGLVTVLE